MNRSYLRVGDALLGFTECRKLYKRGFLTNSSIFETVTGSEEGEGRGRSANTVVRLLGYAVAPFP